MSMFELPAIYLASQSPRRRELLAGIGVEFELLRLRERAGRVADVDEQPTPDELPRTYVERIARIKAEAAWRILGLRGLASKPVLAADTTVTIGSRILGKPRDAADARTMLGLLSGYAHTVLTAIAIRHEGGSVMATTSSVVRFRELSVAEIDAYVQTGEPMDKAGAYAIQGRAQAFIPSITGSYSGIVGLPLAETVTLLRSLPGASAV